MSNGNIWNILLCKLFENTGGNDVQESGFKRSIFMKIGDPKNKLLDYSSKMFSRVLNIFHDWFWIYFVLLHFTLSKKQQQKIGETGVQDLGMGKVWYIFLKSFTFIIT